MASTTLNTPTTIVKEIVTEFGTLIRINGDGTIERPIQTPFVPPTLDDPQTDGISSKDILITQNPNLSARIYLPKITKPDDKVPIYIYFHGGAFLFESAFSKLYNDHLHKLVFLAKVLVVSVEYRLAPENPLPACYHDCWDALKWVASHAPKNTTNTEPWLINHGDFNRVFIGGDSAGGNIVHNIAMFAGAEALPCGVNIKGALMMHPFFFSSKPIGSETVEEHQNNANHEVWKLAYPSAPGGIDNPMINILAPGAPSLATLGCSKIIVFVAGKDCLGLRERGVWYYEALKNSGWQGKIEFYEDEEEDHVYYLVTKPECENANKIIRHMASFLLE